MVKYSSRVTDKSKKRQKKSTKTSKKQMTTQDQPSSSNLTAVEKPLFTTQVIPNELLGSGGTLGTGGTLDSGGVLRSGGNIPTGGAIPNPIVSSTLFGGALASNGLNAVDDLTHQHIIHTLGNMEPSVFHNLQGIAGGYLDIMHPMTVPMRRVLGGSFLHPRNISKMATKDVLKAATPQALARALHSEWVDNMNGQDTGGGLFDSIKNLFKKGLSRGKKVAKSAGKAAAAVGRGAKKGVQLAQAGTKKAIDIGNQLEKAIERGLEVSEAFRPLAELAGPRASGALGAVQQTGKALGLSAMAGREAVERISSAIDPISQILGDIDAPVFST